jgi:hypothetical protein
MSGTRYFCDDHFAGAATDRQGALLAFARWAGLILQSGAPVELYRGEILSQTSRCSRWLRTTTPLQMCQAGSTT